jgi:hypothetical protein
MLNMPKRFQNIIGHIADKHDFNPMEGIQTNKSAYIIMKHPALLQLNP